jgi:CheY-specific phosphatase CheX
VASPIDRDALERALTLVAEESFFTMVDPAVDQASDAPLKEGACIAACVDFTGPFTGTLCCRMTRTLARELTSAFTGARPEDVDADGPEVADLAGEFANMVCGRWLTDVAPRALFTIARPNVEPAPWPEARPMAMLSEQPIWIDVALEP